jgi:hypothetical protein
MHTNPDRSDELARLAMLEIDWIVCLDRERGVVDGCVLCPADGASEEGRDVQVQDCLDCRHLMATSVDRQLEEMCATET